jgi:hypothetical protein
MGRTVLKYVRIYADGYDLSGYASTFGPLICQAETVDITAISDAIRGGLSGHITQGIGALNVIMDATAGGAHALMSGAGTKRTLMAAIGDLAVPAAGVPVYMTELEQTGYQGEASGGAIAVNAPFGTTSVAASTLVYANPWGVLAHANGAETGANSGTGVDLITVSTSFGGYLCYQVTAGNGTATIGIDDSANNSSFTSLLTTGSIDCSAPVSGIVALGRTATVRRYIRWQLTLGTATTVTFALGLHRAVW